MHLRSGYDLGAIISSLVQDRHFDFPKYDYRKEPDITINPDVADGLPGKYIMKKHVEIIPKFEVMILMMLFLLRQLTPPMTKLRDKRDSIFFGTQAITRTGLDS